MAAQLDFGDRELFQQLDADAAALHIRFGESEAEGEEEEESEELRRRLSESQEAVQALQAENRELRRKLNILTRPSGLTMDDTKVDGPLLQILSMNNDVSKQYHQEIEDFIASLVQRYEEQQRAESDKTCFNLKPQPSSFVLEEDPKVTSANMSKKIKEAFSVVGSVLYFTNFCLDKLGQPILNENPQLTDGWEIPKYQQVFTQILSLDGQEIQVKPKRPKPHCFNCGLEDHQMKDCPQPRNAARISEKRKQFLDACGEANNQNFQQRYHADEIEERFGRFKPGIVSKELQDALGVTEKCLPPFIYRMRQLGYPPGWLKEAEMEKSGLTLYDGKASTGDEAEEEDDYCQNRRVTYDISKLINYPGFNMSTPSGVADEWRLFGSMPLQPSQQKDIFAHYLSTYRSAVPKSNSKRLSSHQNSHRSKRQKGNNAEVSADMEMDSDFEMVQNSPNYDGFQFQPPLPPGSPLNATPPPLPRGTPPATPPNFTPPRPPTSTSSALPRNASALATANNSAALRTEGSAMDEDTLTLEELEEQQRLIWAALEQADGTNSDSDLPGGTPLTGNSVASSPSRAEPEVLLEEVTRKNVEVLEPGLSDNTEWKPKAEESENKAIVIEKLIDLTEEHGNNKPISAEELVDLTEEEELDHVDSEKMAENCLSTSVNEVNHEKGSGGDPPVTPGTDVALKITSPIPDMSKFAAGITPFEFDNMAESTGIYLRIRSVLKNSPRNQQKNKKSSL